jgi:hypothetical protein
VTGAKQGFVSKLKKTIEAQKRFKFAELIDIGAFK